MKKSPLLVCLAVAMTVQAQTAPKPATPTTKPATAHPATPRAATSTTASASAIKLPPGVPKVVAPVNTAFSLRYQDIKIGTGALGESNKLWKVFYTGYRAADGVVFDSSDEHRKPVMGVDGKPEMDADGKPKLGDPDPLPFPQGMGRLIPGFDQGVAGMHIGGKRRLFIPWQLAYGTRDMPGPAGKPGIPSKSDLIFDIELVEVTELPQQQAPAPRPAPTATPAHPALPPGHPSPTGANATPAGSQPAAQPAQSAPQPAPQPK